jgi:TolA-binding protein
MASRCIRCKGCWLNCSTVTTGSESVTKFRRAGLLCLGVLWVILIAGDRAWADPVTDYNLAVEFYRQQRWDLAVDACQDFLRKYPEHERAGTARLYLAQSLLHRRRFAEARDQFAVFLKNSPEHQDRPLAQYRLGECSYFLGEYAVAEVDLEKFLKQYPEHELAEWGTVYLGESQLRQKKYEAAAKSFEQAISRFPRGGLVEDAEFGLAASLEARHRIDQALQIYQRIAARPQSSRGAEAQFHIGADYFDQGKFQESATAFQDLARKFPQHKLASAAELNAGYACYHLSEYPRAISHFTKAAQDPEHAEVASYWLGVSLKSAGRYSEAIQTFEASLKAKPDQSLAERLTFQWGDAEFRMAHYARAIELFQQVAKTWPQGELADDALHSAGEAALQAGKPAQAAELHLQFMKLFPQSGLLHVEELLYARTLIAMGDESAAQADHGRPFYDKAADLLRHILKDSTISHTRQLARYQLARVDERLQQDEKVIETLTALLTDRSASLPQELVEAWLLRGNAHLRLNQNVEALQDYQRYAEQTEQPAEKILALAGMSTALTRLKEWKKLPPLLEELNRLDTADSQFSRCALAAGDAAFEAHEWEAAEAAFRRILSRQPASSQAVAAQSGLAHTLYEKKEYREAAGFFEKAMTAPASDVVLQSYATYMHAFALQQAGEKQAALAAFQAAAAKLTQVGQKSTDAPPNPDVGLNAYRCEKAGARLAREHNERTAADQLYEAAYHELKLLPKDEQGELDRLMNEWADLAYRAEDFTRSDEIYRLLVQECPRSPLADDARLILAESLRFGGQLEPARLAFTQLAADEKADDFVRQRALVHLLDLSSEGRRWEEVVAAGRQLESQFPESTHRLYVQYRLGEALLHLKQFPQSRAILEKLQTELVGKLETAPAWWPEVWLLLAEADYWLKDYSALEKVVADFKSRLPDSPLLYRADALLGRSLENRARFPEARAAYLRAIDSESGRGTETAAEAQFRIAESYLKENNLPEALKAYYKVYAGYDAPRFEAAALYQAASCDVSLKHFREAAESYRKLLEEFPQSEFTKKAQARLKELESASVQ